MTKKLKLTEDFKFSMFDHLSEELIFAVLDYLDDPIDKKSFSLVCKSFYTAESRHRQILKPLRSELLINIINRYPFVTHLDLTLCSRVTNNSLSVISSVCKSMLRSVDLSRSRFFSDRGILDLITNCTSLVDIDLSNATELTDSGALAISKARNLERLWLARCKSLSDIGIGCIAVGCRKLKLINLRWCLGVGDLGVGLIAVKCKQIRSLDLSYLPITKKCLPSILQLQYLEDLNLMGCLGLDNAGLATLKQGSKSLKTLNISNCMNVNHLGLSYLTSGAGCLDQLILAHGPRVTEAVACTLQNLSKLQSIRLDGCQVSSSGLKTIGNCCISLRELSLSKCSGVRDDGLSSIVTKHKELRKLDITCCHKITHVSINSITKSCTSLTSLRMESCSRVSKEAFTLIGERCHFLEEVDLTDNEVDDTGLKSITRCSELSSLKIGISLNITDDSLIQVGKFCPKLVELDLYRSIGVTDFSISAIASGCSRLEMINLAYCNDITNNSLVSLSKCSKLRILEIRGCSWISSAGLSTIALGCKQLTELDIKKCYNINDAGLLPLAHFSRSLRQLNLSYCSITDKGLLALASISCLQSMTILHVQGLSVHGLAAALLACGGLKKVKLHTSFKPLLPQAFLQHLESRGCVFLWRDKPYKVELDSRGWKLLLRDAR